MRVHVMDIAKTINLKEFQKRHQVKIVLKEPLVLQHGPKKYVVLLRYGVVAFWDLTKREERRWLDMLEPYLVDRFDRPLEDVVAVSKAQKREGIFRGKIVLKSFDADRLASVSLVLGRSVALERYESEAGKALIEFDAVMRGFGEKGATRLTSKELLKKVGFAMNLQHLTVSQMALLDKPDFTWENPELDKLYQELAWDYELEDRYDVLNEKLKLIFHNVEFILNFLEGRRSLALEVTIVLLIIVEIVLFIYELVRL